MYGAWLRYQPEPVADRVSRPRRPSAFAASRYRPPSGSSPRSVTKLRARVASPGASGIELLEKNGRERHQYEEYEGGHGRAARHDSQGNDDEDHDENPGRQGAAVFEIGQDPRGNRDALPPLRAVPLRRPFLEPDQEHVDLRHHSTHPRDGTEKQGKEPQPHRRVGSQPDCPEHDVDGAYRADQEEHENHGKHGPYAGYNVVAEDLVVLKFEREVARVAQRPARAELVEHVARRSAQFALVEPCSAHPPAKDLHGEAS